MTDDNKDILFKIAALIKEARIANSLTLMELEQRTGIANGDISKIENGKKNFTVTTLVRLGAGDACGEV